MSAMAATTVDDAGCGERPVRTFKPAEAEGEDEDAVVEEEAA